MILLAGFLRASDRHFQGFFNFWRGPLFPRESTLKTVKWPNLKVVNRKLVNRVTATKISLRKVANFRDVFMFGRGWDGKFVVLAIIESVNKSASLPNYRPHFRFPLITLSILASYPCQKMKNRGSIQPRASYTTKHEASLSDSMKRNVWNWIEHTSPNLLFFFHAHTSLTSHCSNLV